jgi:transposase
MKITTIGIDLAKNVFQLHGVDQQGHTVLRRALKRAEMLAYFVKLEPCLIGMEACGSAHHWARQLGQYGHTVKLMAPQFVKPYVKTNKNDANDAEAICEAVSRPNMRFVPIKNVDQQAVLSLHRARQSFIKARTAQANQIRGLLSEYGIIIPPGIGNIAKRIPIILENTDNDLPSTMCTLMRGLLAHLKTLEAQIDAIDETLLNGHKQNEASQRLCQLCGVGPLTASAIIATVGDAKNFSNAGQFAAWLGIVPRQQSSGGKQTLLGMSKRGDTYIRTLLIHGARAAIRYVDGASQPSIAGTNIDKRADKRAGKTNSKLAPTTRQWLESMLRRRHKNVAAVALANKNARIIWALLSKGSRYRPDYAVAKSATA